MKILLFHPVHLPPKDYGGVERVVLWLARGLKELGHEVWVAALEGSVLPPGVQLVPMDPKRSSAVDLLPLIPAGVEIIHFQAPPETPALERLPVPGILTVHGNGKPGERFIRNTVFLSADHARRHGAKVFVHNGVAPDEYDFSPQSKEQRFLFLSKTSWRVKNVAAAIRRCGRAGAGLRVAGGNRPLLARIAVAMQSRMSWEGPVAGSRKAKLLSQAKGLVFPILWPEPFGLVVVESLISGTPVLASRLGSMPELLPEDVGALLDPQNDEEWIEWLRRDRLPFDPERCRSWALQKFTHRTMAESYTGLYRRVCSGETLHSVEPETLISSKP